MRKKKCTMSIHTIIERFQSGMTSNEIASEANVTARYINSVLQQNNVERQPHSSWLRRYTVNENYFKTWSASMAYVLGFFAADGNMPQEAQMISFSQKDPKILEDIREELQSTHPIKTNPRTGVHLLNISSKIMKEDLMQLHGMTPKKSTTLEFPYVPEEYLSHFVRGYFDGDGNIYARGNLASFVGGSLDFMKGLSDVLEKLGLEPRIKPSQKYYRLFISGRKTLKEFFDYIYFEKNLYLERKFELFKDKNIELKNLRNSNHKRTKEAVALRKKDFIKTFQVKQCINTSCKEVGILLATYHSWLKQDEQFLKEMTLLMNESV
ncbi:LAGLIDADG family homing endonuclease [Fictibacillus phosphorivorans]|uniref:LAGLIDADG family homing endonuclease n=1 Tax=Fictibacillus phosphorivorans TaxID=1221500 RepID=UPI0035ECEB15